MCIVLIVIVIAILIFWHCLEQSRMAVPSPLLKRMNTLQISGISSVYYKMMSFLFSAFFAGLAGALFAHTANFISPTDFSWHKVVDELLYCVFGGGNVMWGSPLGAIILTVLPELLLLDEPFMGLAPIVVQEIFDVIQDINRNGTTILLVEQNAKKALQIADYAYVMETGKIVLHGDAADVAANPQVTEAYLGGKK